MARAAGLMILDPDGRLLLMRRARGDFTDHWGLPAGRVEDGETDLQAAIRETVEETGSREFDVDPDAEFRSGDFVAFGATAEGFEPLLNDEHDAADWFALDELPDPVHPVLVDLLRAAVPTKDSEKGKAMRREVHIHIHRSRDAGFDEGAYKRNESGRSANIEATAAERLKAMRD